MDPYEKLFYKMEAERKQAEEEEAKKELSENKEEQKKPSDKIQDEIKTPDKIEAENKLTANTEEEIRPSATMEYKEKPLHETEDDNNWYAKFEAKRKLAEEAEVKKELSEKRKGETGRLSKFKMKLSHLTKLKLKKKSLENFKTEKKPNVQLKVFKLAKNVNTGEIIPDIGVKEGQLRNHVLVVDHNLDDNSFKDDLLIMIEKAGVEYIIAQGFNEQFFRKAADIGLHPIKCSHTKLIDEGNNIEIYPKEGVIFDIDNGQEYKFSLMTDSLQRSIVQKIKIGECLLIGDNLKIKILDIDKDQIKLCANALKVITIYLNKSTSIDDGIKITVLKINFDEVNLAIEAPINTTINRE